MRCDRSHSEAFREQVHWANRRGHTPQLTLVIHLRDCKLLMLWRTLCTLQFYTLIGVYTYLGLTPHPENTVPVTNDLVMHFMGYLVAGFSISLARPTWPWWQRAALLIIYSIAIEIAQHFNPPRTFSVLDILANASGVCTGLMLVFLLEKYVRLFSSLLYWNVRR